MCLFQALQYYSSYVGDGRRVVVGDVAAQVGDTGWLLVLAFTAPRFHFLPAFLLLSCLYFVPLSIVTALVLECDGFF